ncbi:PHD finger protein 12-like isoform X7 [Amphibalanus amphitrite]|uniref:PHD finger protein 12-like isoform X7 n=1 Tax=Amphibalanus amphitrite TaxID=1232801 RepID=UPI001C9032D2|nr:PHD finger protein 12-like isoform X7 [Amphibalanus amphitrite]XP_043197596.1 PHD finger protein 12-like isoform X7 [Amphibalanus amphitrite]
MARDYGGSGSGGLMDEIQALIAPPGDEKRKREGLDLHPYFRRPGKGHNNDRCDACGEGGDLLCCDRCPASFHLGCHDPPIPEEDIPSGDWICHNCKATEALKLGASHSTDWQQETNADDPACADIIAVRSPLQHLIQAASLLNPRQFELPPDMAVNDLLPGETKINPKGSRKRPHELDNGLVPLPAKLCFKCGKSCRTAPLMACDYCPSCFHMDCLDPPMTTMPTGSVWMCPLHVENFLDSEMLKTPRLTERLKLWNRFQGPLDQDVIKAQFFRKVHRRHPPFKYKMKIENTNLVDVPEGVKSHYKNPLPKPQMADKDTLVVPPQGSEATEEEQELWLKSILSLQLGSSEYLEQQKCTAADHPVKQESECASESASDSLPNSGDVQHSGLDGSHHAATNGDLDGRVKKHCPKKFDKMMDVKRSRTDTILKACLMDGVRQERRPLVDDSAELRQLRAQLQSAGSMDLSLLDERLVQLLAVQRLTQLLGPHAAGKLAPRAPLDPVRSAASAVAPRATLTPLNGIGGTELVRYRSLSVGSGADNDLNLDRHGYCAYVSGQHATIFFDDTARRFELLNYSEHGTVVEGVLYGCNFSARTVAGVEESAVEATVHAIAEKRREARRAASDNSSPAVPSKDATMSKRACLERRRCRCVCPAAGPADGPRRGFESSVLLHHGCHLQFGCLRFVFAETGVRRRQDSVVEALLARARQRDAEEVRS